MVDVPKIVFQDRIRHEQFADIPSLQVVQELVFKVFSYNTVQQRFVEQNIESPVEQNLDVPIPQMIEQLKEVPKMVSQNKIPRRTAEEIVDVPVPKVVEEHVGITKVSSQNRVQQRFEKQSVGREAHLGA